MVPRQDNDTINKRSQVYNDYNSVNNQLINILNSLAKNDEELIHIIKRSQIDIDSFSDDPASGSITITNQIRQPILITDIIATWNVPLLTTLNQITLAASTVAAYNNNAFPVLQTVSGGTVTAIAINGTSTGLTSGVFYIPAGGTITVTYTVAPTTFTTAAVGPYPLQFPNGTASLTFGGRTFQLQYSSGLFLATGFTNGMQLDNTGSKGNNITLTISPGSAAHLEICGQADYRKLDRL